MNIPKSLRLPIAAVIAGVFLLVSGCGGGSGGGGGGEDFPTPTLPAGAVKIDATNTDDIATSTVLFLNIFNALTTLKTEAPPSIPDVIKLVIDKVVKRGRNSFSVATRETEDLSAIFCVTGTAIASFDANANSESGTVSFSNCDIGSGILLNGSLSYDASWNDTTLDYNIHVGGTLIFDFGSDTVTVVLNLTESGNDGTGNFSSTVSFSLSGIPGGGFLVTTTQPLVGNALSVQINGGQLIVEGADNTRLRITVTGINVADVELENGSGTFVFHSTINF